MDANVVVRAGGQAADQLGRVLSAAGQHCAPAGESRIEGPAQHSGGKGPERDHHQDRRQQHGKGQGRLGPGECRQREPAGDDERETDTARRAPERARTIAAEGSEHEYGGNSRGDCQQGRGDRRERLHGSVLREPEADCQKCELCADHDAGDSDWSESRTSNLPRDDRRSLAQSVAVGLLGRQRRFHRTTPLASRGSFESTGLNRA